MSKIPKQCRRCRGPLVAQSVEHPYWNGINLVALVHNVPSWVCQRCGYHYFAASVETALSFIVKDYVEMGTIFPIPSTPYREKSKI